MAQQTAINWLREKLQETYDTRSRKTGGIDECQKISLSRQDLQDLLDTLNIVSSDYDRAEELLPPTAGFFFGSVERP